MFGCRLSLLLSLSQMTDDSELLEETEEERLSPSSSSSSSSNFSLKRSDLRWLLLSLNRLSWLLLRSASAPSGPQQQQQQQQSALLLPVPSHSSSSSSRGRKGRERLWQLVPGVLRELLDLNARVSLVDDEELVLPDGPSALIASAAAGQRLPALWECFVWCMRGGDTAAAAAAAPGSSSSSSSSSNLSPVAGIAAAGGAAVVRGHSDVPAPFSRMINLPTRLLASSLVYAPHAIAFPDRLAVSVFI